MVNESQEKDNQCIQSYLIKENKCLVEQRQMDIENMPKEEQEEFVDQEER